MNIVRLFKWITPGFDVIHTAWSLKDWCGADFSELIESKYFIIPDGYTVKEDMCGTPHFYGKLYGFNSITWFDVETTHETEKPYIDNWKRIYLKELTLASFNDFYSGKWRLEEEKKDSPYYEDYKYKLFAVFPNNEYPSAAFESIEKAVEYVNRMKAYEEESKDIEW